LGQRVRDLNGPAQPEHILQRIGAPDTIEAPIGGGRDQVFEGGREGLCHRCLPFTSIDKSSLRATISLVSSGLLSVLIAEAAFVSTMDFGRKVRVSHYDKRRRVNL